MGSVRCAKERTMVAASETKAHIMPNLSFSDYLAIPAISSGALRGLHTTSPAHVKASDFERTEAMDKGSALHTLILEPEQFPNRFYEKLQLEVRRKNGEPYARPE